MDSGIAFWNGKRLLGQELQQVFKGIEFLRKATYLFPSRAVCAGRILLVDEQLFI